MNKMKIKPVKNIIWDSVYNSVWDSVWDSIGYSVWYFIGYSVKGALRSLFR